VNTPEVVPNVVELILATEHGRTTEPSTDRDKAVLLDADLAILAAEGKRYARYAADIRKEYDFVPEADYRKGRTAVLNGFLSRPRIFHTPLMFEEGEESARRNLRAEIEQLQRTV
jgi:predicted metal-dependent HD superfamily phosphohydrolase